MKGNKKRADRNWGGRGNLPEASNNPEVRKCQIRERGFPISCAGLEERPVLKNPKIKNTRHAVLLWDRGGFGGVTQNPENNILPV